MSKISKHKLRLKKTRNTYRTSEYMVLVDGEEIGKAGSVEEVIFLVKMHYPKSDLGQVILQLTDFFNDA